ncbi:carbonic anhydrase family protein [Curvibacter sp. APW13]|uniref:carbonic anhydrase n=1 Tax=Curvibacter sp. APW13 TaxID=3077236 RepID=UPI0028DE18D1|nr:carbonic anhydrase family protein [Curvibacter sp. APW13]MDT8992987.1 carbonic anhydrase family protein [Curvibacter sp. APW13]
MHSLRPSELSSPRTPAFLLMALVLCCAAAAQAATAEQDEGHGKAVPKPAAKASGAKKEPTADIEASSASNPKEVGNQLREALGTGVAPNKKLTVVTTGKGGGTLVSGEGTPKPAASTTIRVTPRPVKPTPKPAAAPAHEEAALATHATHEVHWDYEGENGPANWGKLKPEFNLCAIGKRQSPINIEDGYTLQGPAEPIAFNYTGSNGTVVNNGHTIQVDVQGDNAIVVRGVRYQLLQFHFHTPSEEQVNGNRYPMVAHLVHKNDDGQLAVVGVLLDTGNPNPLIEKVWTYMPLDAGDKVRMPRGILNLNELLPGDQRYYQFIGSLTTPPCSEGVLWMVLKQPVQIGKDQLRMFRQLYPNNARPVQPVNGRPVREAR